jgi:hypothetical protein
MWQGLGILGERGTVQITGNVAAAVADKDSNTNIFSQFHTPYLFERSMDLKQVSQIRSTKLETNSNHQSTKFKTLKLCPVRFQAK